MNLNLLPRIVFPVLRWRARAGFVAEREPEAPDVIRAAGRRTGLRGETYAYWFLRREGYILVARNYRVSGLKGEIDLVGYDGSQLAFIEVKTRSGQESAPEDAITPDKRHFLARMAQSFLLERRIPPGTPWRFDVVAIRARRGRTPDLRLYRNAFASR